MLTVYGGLNGKGKTLYLERIIKKALDKGIKPITNLKDYVEYNSTEYDKDRISYVFDDETGYEIFEGINLLNTASGITFERQEDVIFTANLSNIINTMCLSGSILVLDEPELMLTEAELARLSLLLHNMKGMYKQCYIATHVMDIYRIADRINWVDGYGYREVSLGNIQFRFGMLMGLSDNVGMDI